MDFNFTEEQGMLRDSLAKMIRDQYDFENRRKVVASADGWRKDMWMQFAELGLMMAPFSEEDGQACPCLVILGSNYIHYIYCQFNFIGHIL